MVAIAQIARRDLPPETVGIIVGCCLGAALLILVVVWYLWSARRQRAWVEASRAGAEDEIIYLEESDPSSSQRSHGRQHEAHRIHRQRLRQMQHMRQMQQIQQMQMQAQEASRSASAPFPKSIPPPTLRPGEKPVYRVKRNEALYNTWEYATNGREARLYRG